MKTKNTYFSGRKKFQDFVAINGFNNSESILIQIFSSVTDPNRLNSIFNDILRTLPHAVIIGATTDGEMLESDVTTDKIVVSVSSFEYSTLRVAYQSKEEDSFTCGEELAKKLVGEHTKLLILFSDGLNINGELFLEGIQSVSSDVMIAGGMAGDGAKFENTYLISNDGIRNNGAVGVAIDSQVLQVKSTYSFNWQEIGKPLRITKADRNRVYEINDMKAVDVYARYLGEDVAKRLPATGIEFPLILNRNGVKIARAVVGKKDDGSLIFAGNLSTNDKVHLGFGNSSKILSESVKTRDAFKHMTTEGIFVYSCMARRRFLLDAISIELIPLSNLASTSGFFTYGEFFKSKRCELLNQTMTIVALSENAQIGLNETLKEEEFSFKFDSNTTYQALSHLIQETSRELQESNENLVSSVAIKTKELQKKIKELEEVSRVKSEFFANMSHEIRTPLHAILGFSEILRAGEKDSSREEYFNIIKSSGEMLLTIVNDILDFSKIQSGHMLLENRAFLTKKPFKELGLTFYERAKESSINLKIIFDENLPKYFTGDEVRIKQVASNFLSNAIKFTKEGGEILMSISFDTSVNSLIFSVEDNGIGIEKKNLHKIFDSFTQADITTTRNYGGTGLGLSISNSLIKEMNGEISVESEVGRGSRFRFSIPYIETSKKGKEEEKTGVLLDEKFDAKVLLVEDNETNQMLMTVLLNNLNIEVDLAKNGLEAIEKFEKNSYDLIIIDENMPIMSGIEATRKIIEIEKRNTLHHTPIIAVTANVLASDKERFLEAGMDCFLAKPIEHKEFITVLQRFIK